MKIFHFLLPSLCMLSSLCAEYQGNEVDVEYENQEAYVAVEETDNYEDNFINAQQRSSERAASARENNARRNRQQVQAPTTTRRRAAQKPIAQTTPVTNPPSSQPMSSAHTPTIYNKPARPPAKNALNLWVQGEALLWQANEENLTYAYKVDDLKTDFKTLDFSWDWGFRVSLGYNTPRDGWDFSLMWTHIKNHSRDHVRAHGDTTITPVWQINNIALNGTAEEAKAHWSINLEQVDLALGKEYFVGKYCTLRPNGGIRADWIFQQYHVRYVPVLTPAFPQKINMDNRYFGLGFFAGIDTDWLLGQGFSIFGMADYAVLVGFFHVEQKVSQTSATTGNLQTGELKNSFRCGRGILDLALGLKWSHLYSNRSWGLTFKAGYEYHLFFDQNQFAQFSSSQPQFFKPEGNLTYQGVMLSGQIDF